MARRSKSSSSLSSLKFQTYDAHQDALVARVASTNANTIVVVNSVGPIIMEAWINHPNGKLDLHIRLGITFSETLLGKKLPPLYAYFSLFVERISSILGMERITRPRGR